MEKMRSLMFSGVIVTAIILMVLKILYILEIPLNVEYIYDTTSMCLIFAILYIISRRIEDEEIKHIDVSNPLIKYDKIVYEVNDDTELKLVLDEWNNKGIYATDLLRDIKWDEYPIYVGVYNSRPVVMTKEDIVLHKRDITVIHINKNGIHL